MEKIEKFVLFMGVSKTQIVLKSKFINTSNHQNYGIKKQVEHDGWQGFKKILKSSILY